MLSITSEIEGHIHSTKEIECHKQQMGVNLIKKLYLMPIIYVNCVIL